MADYTIPNLAGASEVFNGFAKKLDAVKDSMLAGLEVDASTLARTMSADLTSLTTELRDFMPELPAIPDINLQSQLSSLSGLDIGSNQYNTLLSSITDSFGTAVFKNKLYVLGGQTETGSTNTIYSTTDVKYWDQTCPEGLYNVDNKCVDEYSCKYI